jgi:glycine oxidase
MRTADAIVIGGGVIGCSIARELASRNVRVLLIERHSVGAEASSAAAGTLGAQAECDEPGPLLDLALASRRLFPEFLAALRDETNVDYGPGEGVLYCALSEADEQVLDARRRWQSEMGLRVERLSREEALGREACLTAETRWALYFPDDRWLDPRLLTAGLGAAAERAGVRIVTMRTAVRIVGDVGRVSGVVCDGETHPAGTVVNAAGSWAGLIELPPGGPSLPVLPVRGQMVALGGLAPAPRHALYSVKGYVVPRTQSLVVAGSTFEDVGYDKRVTVGGVAGILASVTRLVPDLERSSVIETWAGLRPVTPDRLPILGAAPAVAGLYHATGHGRNGILLAPITGRVLADLVVDGRTSVALDAFSPARFG